MPETASAALSGIDDLDDLKAWTPDDTRWRIEIQARRDKDGNLVPKTWAFRSGSGDARRFRIGGKFEELPDERKQEYWRNRDHRQRRAKRRAKT